MAGIKLHDASKIASEPPRGSPNEGSGAPREGPRPFPGGLGSGPGLSRTPKLAPSQPKLAPIWFVCQFRSAVASALGGRPVFLLVTQDLGPWGVVSANLGIFVPRPSFIYNLFLPIMIWDEKEKHFHCNLVSRRLGVMRQLVPDEYCRGHHSRIIYIKVFLQYIRGAFKNVLADFVR